MENKPHREHGWITSTGNLRNEEGVIPPAYTPDASFHKQKVSRQTAEKGGEIFKSADVLLLEQIQEKEQKLSELLKESIHAVDKVARQAKKIEADHLRTEIKELKNKQTQFLN